VVIAITMTADRHKRHMQFLTFAPNFRGSADLSEPVAFTRYNNDDDDDENNKHNNNMSFVDDDRSAFIFM